MTDEIILNDITENKILDAREVTDCLQNHNETEATYSSININTEINENAKPIKNLNIESSINKSLESTTGVCLQEVSDTTNLNPTNTADPILTIKFSNIDNLNSLKEDTLNFFNSFIDFNSELDEANLLLSVYKDDDLDRNEWVFVNENEVESTYEDGVKRKTKFHQGLEKKIKLEDLFVLDTAPSLSTKNCLKYESKFSVVKNSDATINSDREESKPLNISLCFNCDENHNLRDCSKPKNQAKINAARQKFKSQQTKTTRYHLENEQMYAHLKAGKLSTKLRSALGLDDNQLPDHIYLMRRLGYPPGWYKELEPSRSELVLFDLDGKRDRNEKSEFKVDPDMIIEYPGFNVPFEHHIKDEYRLHRCPPYSKEFNKHNMVKHVQCNWRGGDDYDTCNMDIDEAESSDKNQDSVEPQGNSTSPTLFLLESEKEKILQQLSEDSVKEDSAVNLSLNDNINNVTRSIMASSFGTPIIKSTSPYCNLPSCEKFSKNVSEVINFENLPNTTGNYEQLTDVLKGVRKSMKDISKGSS